MNDAQNSVAVRQICRGARSEYEFLLDAFLSKAVFNGILGFMLLFCSLIFVWVRGFESMNYIAQRNHGQLLACVYFEVS